MKVDGMQKTNLSGVWTVWGERTEDRRGLVREMWKGQKSPWKLTLITVSPENVLRGFHADKTRWRMLTCVAGSVRHIAADQKGHWVRHLLNPDSPSILWKPGIYSAYLVLSPSAVVVYHVSDMYRPGEQMTRRWDHLGQEIWQPFNPYALILSPRDAAK